MDRIHFATAAVNLFPLDWRGNLERCQRAVSRRATRARACCCCPSWPCPATDARTPSTEPTWSNAWWRSLGSLMESCAGMVVGVGLPSCTGARSTTAPRSSSTGSSQDSPPSSTSPATASTTSRAGSVPLAAAGAHPRGRPRAAHRRRRGERAHGRSRLRRGRLPLRLRDLRGRVGRGPARRAARVPRRRRGPEPEREPLRLRQARPTRERLVRDAAARCVGLRLQQPRRERGRARPLRRRRLRGGRRRDPDDDDALQLRGRRGGTRASISRSSGVATGRR